MSGVFLWNFEDELTWGDGADRNRVLRTKPDRNQRQLLQGPSASGVQTLSALTGYRESELFMLAKLDLSRGPIALVPTALALA